MVRPYISSMTKSELMALMVGGFATIAGGVLVAYVGMGIDAGHLVAASVISAPAALLISKLMIPETEQSMTRGHVELSVDEKHANIVDAATNGALDGMKLTLNVVAMLIAFLALVALVDAILGLIGEWTGALLGYNWHWSLAALFGYVFAPFAYLLGIPWADCFYAGELLGKKMVLNEFIAYAQMMEWSQPDSGVVLRRAKYIDPDVCIVRLCQLWQRGHSNRRHRRHCPRTPHRIGHPRHTRHDRRHTCNDDDCLCCGYFDLKKRCWLTFMVGYSNFEHNQQFRRNDDDLETDGRPGGDHREVNR